MRKITKIFALILAVCLFVGAVAIVSSAAAPTNDSQITEYIYSEAPYNGLTYSGSFSTYFTVGTAGTYNDNTFYGGTGKADVAEATLSAQNYIQLGTYGSNRTDLFRSFSYYVVEFDFATGEETVYPNGMYLGGFEKNNGNKTAPLCYVVTDTDGTQYLSGTKTYDGTAKNIPLATGGHWSHITFIVNGSNADVYVNGEYLCTTALKSNFKYFNAIAFGFSAVTVDPDGTEYRLDNLYCAGYGSTDVPYVSDGDGVFGLDDYYALGNKNLPLTFVEDIQFNKNFEFPAPNFGMVNIKGTSDPNDYYHNLAAALDYLADGDTIVLTEDLYIYDPLNENIEELTVEGADIILLGEAADLYTYADGKLTKSVLYTANWTDSEGNTVLAQSIDVNKAPDAAAISANFGINGNYNDNSVWYASVNGAENVLLSELEWTKLASGDTVTLTPRYGTVIWNEHDGTNSVTEQWFVGTVEPLSIDSVETNPIELLNNGWYELEYAWNSEDFTITEEGAEYTLIQKPYSAIDAKINYTIGSEYRASLYLPKQLEDVTNVEVTLITLDRRGNPEQETGAPVDGTRVKINDGKDNYTEYIRYNAVIRGLNNWYQGERFNVTFTVELDGATYKLCSENMDTSISKYLSGVVSHYPCGSIEEKLAFNWLQYAAMTMSISGTSNSAITIYENHIAANQACANVLPSLDTQIPASSDESLTYADGLSGFGVGYNVTASNIKLTVFVPEALASANDVKVRVSFKGIKDGKRNQEITFGVGRHSNLDYTEGGVKYLAYLSGDLDIMMYNMNEVMTISIYDGEELYASGTYTLREYLYQTVQKHNARTDTDSDDYAAETKKIEAAKALVAFGTVSKEYTDSYAADAE